MRFTLRTTMLIVLIVALLFCWARRYVYNSEPTKPIIYKNIKLF
jgi:hypothetical protein